jgi:hypothetical protein
VFFEDPVQHWPWQQSRKLAGTTRNMHETLAVITAEELLRRDWAQQTSQVKHIALLGRTQSVFPIGVARIGSTVGFVATVGVRFVAAVGVRIVSAVGVNPVARVAVAFITPVCVAGILRTMAAEIFAAIMVTRRLALMLSIVQWLRA